MNAQMITRAHHTNNWERGASQILLSITIIENYVISHIVICVTSRALNLQLKLVYRLVKFCFILLLRKEPYFIWVESIY